MKTLGYILKEMVIGALTFVLVLSVVGMTFVYQPKVERAEAGAAVTWVTGGIGTIWEGVTAIANSALRYKELVLDPIAWNLANIVIQRMTRETIRWINSGFQGQPSFMRDFGGFLTDAADQAVGNFIASSSTTNFLCSPFRLDIRHAISIQYAKSRNFGSLDSSCRLSGVTANINNFFNINSIATGGWGEWFKVTQDPQYNPYGSLLMVTEQLTGRLSNLKGQESQITAWGKGFLSSRECTVVENRNICRTVTPGSTIEGALNDALGNPTKRVAVADEINEILAALFQQLVTSAFNEATGGLLGLTGHASAPSQTSTYFADLTNDTTGGSVLASGANSLQTAITNETTYRGLVQSIVTSIEDAATYRERTYPGDSCHSGQLTPELQIALTRAQGEVTTATNNITTLTTLLSRYNAAAGAPDASTLQNQILEEYLRLMSSGSLHMEPHITEVRSSSIPEVNRLISRFIQNIDTACDRNRGQ